jgi:outer membrane protein insertion porin family
VRDEDLVRTAGASDDLRRTKVTTRTSAVGVQLAIDRRRDAGGRPNPLTPDRGYHLELRGSIAEDLLIGSDRFIKLGAHGQHFWRPWPRLLVSNGLRYDHGIPLGGAVLLPEVERFFAGGDTTVRGFERDQLATEVIVQPSAPLMDVEQLRVLPAGGNIRAIHNLDFQVNVWELWGFPVASAIFFDTGLVTNSLDGFRIQDLRHSLGIGFLRIVAPFGALSFEYAIPLDPKLGDDPRGRFHINFGLLFN